MFCPLSYSHERKKFLPSASASGLCFGVGNIINGQSRGKKGKEIQETELIYSRSGGELGKVSKKLHGLGFRGKLFFLAKWQVRSRDWKPLEQLLQNRTGNRNQKLKNCCFEL